MRNISCWTVLLAASALAADNPVKFDTPEARVLEVTSAAGQKSAMHKHEVNRVMIYLDDGDMTLTDAQGKVEHVRWRAGQALWSPAGGPHVSQNVGAKPYRIVEVELKNPPAGAMPANPLDPVKVAPKNYKVEFENPQVRVIRAKYAPHEAGVLHEHMLNRLVVVLTDEHMKVTTAEGKTAEVTGQPGEMAMGGKAKHQEENLSDHPFEVVVVEFKR